MNDNSRGDSTKRPTMLRFTPYGLALAALCFACVGGDDKACDWLFAPKSFADADTPGCTAEPAGYRCDPSTGRCAELCAAGEYVLTCRSVQVSGLASDEESASDPVITADRLRACSPMPQGVDGGSGRATYCCRCEP